MKTVLLAAVAIVAFGCTSKPAERPEVSGTLETVDMGHHPPTVKLPDPEQNEGHVGRKPRRITVAQLRESIITTTGRQWTQIGTLAPSLGQADFALTVSESTEANLVFAKFLEDGAREVCLAVAQADLTRQPADKVLSTGFTVMGNDFTTMNDDAIKTNLAQLAIRFWGQPFSDAERDSWVGTFKTVAARAKSINRPQQAWGAMCIAFMTDPRFITY